MITIDEILRNSVRTAEILLLDLKRCKVQKIKTLKISSAALFEVPGRAKVLEGLIGLHSTYIYLFRIEGDSKDIDAINRTYEIFDKSNKPRVPGKTFNISRFNQTNSPYLYVGCSKDILTRTKQHLGDGQKRTYSLDLCHWFPKDIDLTLEIYSINIRSQAVLEFIEQGFWDAYKPLFGKRSGL